MRQSIYYWEFTDSALVERCLKNHTEYYHIDQMSVTNNGGKFQVFLVLSLLAPVVAPVRRLGSRDAER